MTVKAKFNNGKEKDITDEVTTVPADSSQLGDTALTSVQITWNYKGLDFHTSTPITVKPQWELIGWSTGTPEQIKKMLKAHYDGEINIHDYWAMGDTRTVHLSAMPAKGVGESHAEQDVELVLMHSGGFQFSDDSGECAFAVGQRDCLMELGYMFSTSTSSSHRWGNSNRRTWCNSTYREAFPEELRDIFKQFKVTSGGAGALSYTTDDYFTLPAEKEVFGYNREANDDAEETLFQLEWFKNSVNRQKKANGSAAEWSERSKSDESSAAFCTVSENGTPYTANSKTDNGIAPLGCI